MAVSLKDPQGGGIDELNEINVTPFIDVMASPPNVGGNAISLSVPVRFAK